MSSNLPPGSDTYPPDDLHVEDDTPSTLYIGRRAVLDPLQVLHPYFHVMGRHLDEAKNATWEYADPEWTDHAGDTHDIFSDNDYLVRYDTLNPGPLDQVRIVGDLGEGWHIADAVEMAFDDLEGPRV